MKPIIFSFVFLIAYATASSATGTGAEEIVAGLYEQKSTEVTGEHIPPQSRDEVIAVLRSKAEDGDSIAERILFRLGDKKTVQKYVDIFVDTNGVNWQSRRTLQGTPAVAVIEALAPLMFREEEYRFHNSPHAEFPGAWGISYESAAIVRGKLITTPEIPPVVAAWAKTLPGLASPELRDTMRQWWEQNREHFESRNLDRLQPLRAPDVTDTDSSESVTTASDQQVVSAQDAAPSDSVAAAGPRSGDGERRLWPYGLAAVLAVVSVGIVIYRVRAS